MRSFDVQVAGAGIVGKTLALALARLGLSVALRGAPTQGGDREDVRAYALNPGSVALLRGLKVWDALPEDARTAVHDMLVPLNFSSPPLTRSGYDVTSVDPGAANDQIPVPGATRSGLIRLS